MAKKAIIRAKLDGVLTELLFKTGIDNVVYSTVDGQEVMLSTKLAEIITDIGTRAKSTDVESQIAALKQEMLGDAPVEAYNTFTELAAYIAEHKDAADALTAAIGNKADKSTVEAIQETLNGLGALATKSTVSESDLDSALAEKVNAAAEGNHAHANKTVLDGITEAKVTAWDAAEQNAKDYADGLAGNYDASGSAAAAEQAAKTYADGLNTAMDTRMQAVEGKAHEHSNKTVLDGITSTKVAAWDAAEGNAKTYADGLNTDMDTRVKAVEEAKHTHTNKTVLDGITAEKVTEWDGAKAGAVAEAKAYADGLAGNYDTKGSAATAESNAKAYADSLGTVTIGGTAYDLEIEIVE